MILIGCFMVFMGSETGKSLEVCNDDLDLENLDGKTMKRFQTFSIWHATMGLSF